MLGWPVLLLTFGIMALVRVGRGRPPWGPVIVLIVLMIIYAEICCWSVISVRPVSRQLGAFLTGLIMAAPLVLGTVTGSWPLGVTEKVWITI